MNNKEILRKKLIKDDQYDLKMEDQQESKRKVKYFIIASNIVFYGLGSTFLISYFFRTFVSIQNDDQDKNYQNKAEQEIMKYKLDEIFHIIYLHSACLAITYLLNVIKEVLSENKLENQSKNIQKILLHQNALLEKYIFNYPLFATFFLNSIYSAWVVTNPLQMKRLIYLVMIHLGSYIHNSIANTFPIQTLLSQLRNLLQAMAIITHLMIILNNQGLATPLKF